MRTAIPALFENLRKFFGVMPLVKVFTTKELEESLTDAGFAIDYQWQPSKDKAVFIVAKKGTNKTRQNRTDF